MCVGGGSWHSEELSVKSAGCPWISSVVTQPRAPWRSFRQLSRTRPAAVLNSSLQRPTPDEQLQHTGQFPYKPPPPTPPPCSPSLTPPLLMPAGILTVLMNITTAISSTPSPPQTHTHTHTHTLTHTHLATVWWEVHDALPPLSLLKTQRDAGPSEGQQGLQDALPYICLCQLWETEEIWDVEHAQHIPP